MTWWHVIGRLWVCHFVKCGLSFKQQVPRSDSLCIGLLAFLFPVEEFCPLQLSMQAFAYFAYFASSWIHWAKASAKAALSVSAAGSSGRKLRPQAVKMDGRSARRQALCKPLVQRAQAVNQAAKKVPRKRLSNTWRIKIAYLQKLQYNKFYRSTGTVRL